MQKVTIIGKFSILYKITLAFLNFSNKTHDKYTIEIQ